MTRGTAWRAIRTKSRLHCRRTDSLMKALFSHLLDRVLVLVRGLGPYAAIELLLPGGSVVALLYWWYRQRLRTPPDLVRTRRPWIFRTRRKLPGVCSMASGILQHRSRRAIQTRRPGPHLAFHSRPGIVGSQRAERTSNKMRS